MEKSDYLSLSTIAEGELGHPVLLIHDLNASLNDWEALIPPLVDAGHIAHACDLFGHGQSHSPSNPDHYYAQLHLTAVRHWIDSLELISAPVLIGHGFGAYLCLRYAYGHPYRVFKLVLINPLLTPEQIKAPAGVLFRHAGLRRIAGQVAPEWTRQKLLGLRKGCCPEVEKRVLECAAHTSPFNMNVMKSAVDLTPGLRELPTRSLFVLGMADPLLDMARVVELVEDQVDFSCQTMPGVGHRPHLEAPEKTNQMIINFLLGM